MNNNLLKNTPPRIEVVDALRGFAVMAIILLHNIEHFNYYSFPEETSGWLQSVNSGIWDTMFFLFGGKAYAIFALLFGFTFYLMLASREKKGEDFKYRYMWRLVLLFVIGNVNAAFFPGEILVLYAIIGFVLVPVRHLSNKVVFVIAIFLMLQPLAWIKVIYSLVNPDYLPAKNLFSLRDIYPALGGDSFIGLIKANLYTGQLASLTWAWNHGRFFQTASLFMLGMLLGRKKMFYTNKETTSFWIKILIIAVVSFIPLYIVKELLVEWIKQGVVLQLLQTIIGSWVNVTFMGVLVASFVLLYRMKADRVLKVLAPYGKMSLTNYVMQSVIGSMLYYGYGLALHKTCGTLYSFLIGLIFMILQISFCHWWLNRYAKGPLESLWHAGTWIGYNKR